MAIYGYTKNYKLIKPQFDTDTWHDYVYDNLDTIDAIMSAIYSSGNWQGFWTTNTAYTAGDVIIDRDTDTMYKVMVDHVTSENTFTEEQTEHPDYYELWSPNNLAESWAIDMDGLVSNVDYSSKAYAISSALIDAGSSKEWAIGSGEIGTTGEHSAKKYATDAHNDYISMTTDANVVAVGSNIADVNAVGQSISNVNTVASDISSVNTVAGVSTDVATVASIATAVSNVSGIESEVLDVSDNRTDISTVASNIGDVSTVAGISGDVSTVANNDVDVTTVATNISDVNAAAANMTAIQAAPTAASNAASFATLAQEWATKMDGQVASTDYSSKYYAGQSATSAQAAQDALEEIHGVIAIPIGTIFQAIYVDESLDMARAINGQLISSTKFDKFRLWLNKVQAAIPNLFTTETNWQAEKALSKLGQVGKFVIDDENQTIRLPAVVNAQGLLGLSGIGNLVSESLPNITGSFHGGTAGADGAFTDDPVMVTAGWANLQNQSYRKIFNASHSSSIYQDGAPVQQEAIQYPYYIQVATGIEEELPAIREYKINTPFFFGQSMYSENDPYNASWLASKGQYNASSVHPDMYTQLIGVELNGSLNVGDTIEIDGKTYVKRGLPVVLSTGTYTDYDFVVDQDNSQFRLPLLNGCENIPDWANAQNISTGIPFTVPCDGWLYGAGSFNGDAGYIVESILVGLARGTSNWASNGTVAVRVKKGDVFSSNASFSPSYGLNFIPAIGNGTLYYYVGDTIQDASLINAGAVLGQLSDKISRTAASDKELVVSWGSPDYTAGVDYTSNWGSVITTQKRGWLWVRGNAVAGNPVYLSIGSVSFNVTENGDTTAGVGSGAFFRIPPTQFQVTGGNGYARQIIFFPCMGA